jgi:hypothetical protein
LNTVQFRAGLGYTDYVNNPRLNRQTTTISPDSAIQFNIYSGDVKINIHDQFSLQQEAVSQGTLSGVSQLERFTNNIGIAVLWDLNETIWTFGYDHFNFIALNGANSSGGTISSLNNTDHSTDQLSASVGFKLATAVIGGFEATASYSDYPAQTRSNYSSISVGPHIEFQLTPYTHVFLSGGFKGYSSGANAPGSVSVNNVAAQPSQGNQNGWYANASFIHRLNKYYSDRLDIAHNDDVQGISGHTISDGARYTGSWRVNRNVTLGLGMFYENVKVSSGPALSGAIPADYSRFGVSLNTDYRLTDHADLGLGYQLVNKAAATAAQNYQQNRISLSFGYRF